MSKPILVAALAFAAVACAKSPAPTAAEAVEAAPNAETAGAAEATPESAPSAPPSHETAEASGSAGADGAADDSAQADGAADDSAAVDHSAWQATLDAYATADGGFRYEALAANADDLARLDAYIAFVGDADTAGWPRDVELAFLINAYNALTVRDVVRLWPVESVLSEDGFFDGTTHRVAGAEMTLNGLENEQIRARFGEPRIHFAVNCASTGCPPLAAQALTAANLEEVLDTQTRAFVGRTTTVDGQTATVSQIFEWFAGDFEAAGGVLAFVRAHAPDPLAAQLGEGTTLAYTPYDWSVNAR